MTTLYACAGSGNCFKPWLAMNQLGLEYELEMINVLEGEQKSAEFLAINPLGVVPFLRGSSGEELGESNAMLWFLAEGTELMPKTAAERAEALQWMFFEQSKLEPFISPARFAITILPSLRSEREKEIAEWQQKAKNGLDRLNEHLTERQFILQSGYSLADIAVFGYVHVTEEAGIGLAEFPQVKRWISDVAATKGYRPLSQLGSTLTAAA